MDGGRLLIADDDPRLLQLVSRYLVLQGFEVEAVTDGLSAVESATASPPDLVILDIMMPGIDGIEACRRIREHPATMETPVLIFSALTEEAEAAKRAGANGLVAKPFSLPSLVSTVKEYLPEA